MNQLSEETRKTRAEAIREMRHTQRMSYQEIGVKFSITRERVRQILASIYADGRVELPKRIGKRITRNCEGCGMEMTLLPSSKRKFHNQKCQWDSTALFRNPFLRGTPEHAHARYEWTKKNSPDKLAMYRARAAAAARKHLMATSPAYREKQRAYYRGWEDRRMLKMTPEERMAERKKQQERSREYYQAHKEQFRAYERLRYQRRKLHVS